jgi:hypothetical protein
MSETLAQPPFVLVENRKTGHDAIKLTSGPFRGIIYSYGKVKFEPQEDDTCKLNFEYEVHENHIEYNKEEFEFYIGELLQFIMMDELQRNNITYTGGIDENRNEDSE